MQDLTPTRLLFPLPIRDPIVQDAPNSRMRTPYYTKYKLCFFFERNFVPKIDDNLVKRDNYSNRIDANYLLLGNVFLLLRARLSMDVSNAIQLPAIHLMDSLRVATKWAISVPITVEVGVFNLHRMRAESVLER